MFGIKKIFRKFVSTEMFSGHGENNSDCEYTGTYGSWKEAMKNSAGYNEKEILEKVKHAALKVKEGKGAYERDSIIFNKHEYDPIFLNALITASTNQELCVIDFGGSLGSSYFQYRPLLSNIKRLNWMVVEQQHFVDCGKVFFEDDSLVFFNSIEEALKFKQPQLFLASCVLQYLEKPFELIEKIIDKNIPFIFVDRSAFVNSVDDRITIQNVPESIYKASYPAWFFNEEKFKSLFLKKYKIVNTFESDLTKPITLQDHKKGYWKGFLFKRNA